MSLFAVSERNSELFCAVLHQLEINPMLNASAPIRFPGFVNKLRLGRWSWAVWACAIILLNRKIAQAGAAPFFFLGFFWFFPDLANSGLFLSSS